MISVYMQPGVRSSASVSALNILSQLLLTSLVADLLACQAVEAIKEAKLQCEEFSAFDLLLREKYTGQVEEWETMIAAWEKDHSLPCPYIPSHKRKSSSCIRFVACSQWLCRSDSE